jgi:hypothetical protein
VNVDPESRRISVRVARFGETHSGFGPEVKVPRNANLDAAHVGTSELKDGSSVRVAVLPMNTTHAAPNLAALHAAAWYENSGLGVARGRYSADAEGIRFDGVLFDDIDDAKVQRIVASSASGDWRSAIALKSFGDFEHAPSDFVGSCIVNIGGYSDTYRPGQGQRLSLVASASGDYISIEEGNTVEDDVITPAEEAPAETPAEEAPAEEAPAEEAPAEETVTITASALLELVSASGDQLLGTPVLEEAHTALIAGGHMQAPDPNDARFAALESVVINLAFQGE